MENQLYVKTDGPVPEGVPITVGRAYAVDEPPTGLRRALVNDRGDWQAICIPRCSHASCIDWTFCDFTGTPVPAPWEPVCTECGGNGACGAHEDDCRMVQEIDYRAHAETLAKALQDLVENAWASCEVEDGQLVGRATREEWDAHCAATDRACAALAAYTAAKEAAK